MATRYLDPYRVGLWASSGLAKLAGTGADSGRLRASISTAAPGLVIWNTIVYRSGVVIPGIGLPAYFELAAPRRGAGLPNPK